MEALLSYPAIGKWLIDHSCRHQKINTNLPRRAEPLKHAPGNIRTPKISPILHTKELLQMGMICALKGAQQTELYISISRENLSILKI
jgi:hypothetical protein